MNKKRAKLREANCYDDIKIRVIDRFREQDPMTLSNSELRSAIDYMLAYRWALNGDEQVLHEYIEASKLRNKNKNESKNMNKKHIRLTENDLHRIVKESVNKILKEEDFSGLDVNSQGSYELTYGEKSRDPKVFERKIEILDNFGYALSSAIQLYMANAAGMFRESNPDVYKRMMKIRSDLIHAGGCSFHSDALGLVHSDNSESDEDYRREMRQAEYEF